LAENARLQAALDETHGRGVWLWSQLQATATAIVQLTIDGIHFLERERDGYKARDKLRGEALELAAGSAHGLAFLHPDCPGHSKEFMDCQHPICVEALAAIDATPAEAHKEARP
jgi:hypothetical protein